MYVKVLNALYINSELSGVPQELQKKKFVRSFAQRLKGKHVRMDGLMDGCGWMDGFGSALCSGATNSKSDSINSVLENRLKPSTHLAQTLQRVNDMPEEADMEDGQLQVQIAKVANALLHRLTTRGAWH